MIVVMGDTRDMCANPVFAVLRLTISEFVSLTFFEF